MSRGSQQVNMGVNHPDGSLVFINPPPIFLGNSIHLISGLFSQKRGYLCCSTVFMSQWWCPSFNGCPWRINEQSASGRWKKIQIGKLTWLITPVSVWEAPDKLNMPTSTGVSQFDTAGEMTCRQKLPCPNFLLPCYKRAKPSVSHVHSIHSCREIVPFSCSDSRTVLLLWKSSLFLLFLCHLHQS